MLSPVMRLYLNFVELCLLGYQYLAFGIYFCE